MAAEPDSVPGRARNPLIVALDRSDLDGAAELAAGLRGHVGMLKVGLELFVSAGPESVRRIRPFAPVFLDLKLHDIPNTVGRAARQAGRLGPTLLTVHALGGGAMVRAAVDEAAAGAEEAGFEPPDVVGVTVLSSVGADSLASPASLAFEAVSAGAAGVVCSGEHVREVREALDEGPIVVVPGIRPGGFGSNDHVRVLTPRDALAAGADLLVVGRPITGASDPAAAARMVLADIG